MFRSHRCLYARVAACVASLSVPLERDSYWMSYQQTTKQPHQQPATSAAAAPVHPAAPATLECFALPHSASQEVCLQAIHRWTELDNDEAISALLAGSAQARKNLSEALISHQQSIPFVAHVSRAIANASLDPVLAAHHSQSPPAMESESNAGGENQFPQIAEFANQNVLPVLVQSLLKSNELMDVDRSRGVAWVLQALQNMILKEETAAVKCAEFNSSQVSGGHDSECTAEHHVALAVLNILERSRQEGLFAASTLPASRSSSALSREDKHVLISRRLFALDSALACIARLLSISTIDAAEHGQRRGGGHAAAQSSSGAAATATEPAILHRAEKASHQIFRAVVETLNSDFAQLDAALQHKAWECLRQLVGVRDNIPPLLGALHAADGMSGMKVLKKWMDAAIDDLPSLFAANATSNHSHEVAQRLLCGLDVLNELTAASVTASSSSSPSVGEEEEEDQGQHHSESLVEGEANEEHPQKTDANLADSDSRRWDSSMNSITSGVLSQFALRVLNALYHTISTSSTQSDGAHSVLSTDTEKQQLYHDIRIRCLTLLIHLSQNDPFVRSGNSLVVLQKTILKSMIHQLSSSSSSLLSESDCSCCQKAFSIIWNCLNFGDAVQIVSDLRLKEDVEVIYHRGKDREAGDDQPNFKHMIASAERLLEKMKQVLKPTQA